MTGGDKKYFAEEEAVLDEVIADVLERVENLKRREQKLINLQINLIQRIRIVRGGSGGKIRSPLKCFFLSPGGKNILKLHQKGNVVLGKDTPSFDYFFF